VDRAKALALRARVRIEPLSELVELHVQPGGVKALFSEHVADNTVGLAWLGQAGFAVRCGTRRLMIDPYLSDSLAEKYRGKEFPHVRMMPPPVEPDEVRDLDLVLCTHRHSDHMDPGTLPVIAKNNPKCRFVVPAAERESAIGVGLPAERIIAVNAGEVISPIDEIEITAVPAAHEELKTNDKGEHHFLGYILRLAGVCIYHSGDCVPYDGLAGQLRSAQIDLALLPVNGRDEYRTSRGIIGNMTFDEAAMLCHDAGIPRMIPHHFGMFDFNTVDPEELRKNIGQAGGGLQCVLPTADLHFVLMK